MSKLLHFNGINGATGTYGLEPMTDAQLCDRITRERYEKPEYSDVLEYRQDQDRLKEISAKEDKLEEKSGAKQVTARIEGLKKEKRQLEEKGVKEGVDPTNLAQAGWGVIFGTPESLTPQIKEALAPLLDLRRDRTEHFSVYEEGRGYRPDTTARDFLAAHGAKLASPVDPEKVPYYLLIVGSPEEVPYRFQYQLDVQYAVGRLDFGADVEAYANYARSVVAAEKGEARAAPRAAFFGVANPEDSATELSAKRLVRPLYENLKERYSHWQMDAIMRDEATKDRLLRLIGGPETPTFLFTASHGMEFPRENSRQVPHQGALLCYDWPGPNAWRGNIPQDFYLAGDDLTDAADLRGLIAFFFACYGAGTPLYDEYSRQVFKERPEVIAKRAFTAALPRAMLSLSRGALAVVGHVERAWGASFTGPRQSEQITVFESAVERLLKGHPVGSAMEYFDSYHAALSTQLTQQLESGDLGPKYDPYDLASMWTANNDARGYVIVGDPAACLPVVEIDEEMLKKPTDASFTDRDWRYTPHSVKEYVHLLRKKIRAEREAKAKLAVKGVQAEREAAAVTAHLEAEIAPGDNLLYCAAFQIAWNRLTDDVLGGPVQLEGNPRSAEALNRRLVDEQEISEDYYLAMAGFGRDGIVGRVERALLEKFERTPGLDLTLNSPEDILAYAFLEKSLPFDTKFEVFDEPLRFSDGAAVQAFGVEENRAAADQVVILDYRGPDDFIIKLQGSAEIDAEVEFGARIDRPRITDDIILAKITPQATLLETIDAVLARAAGEVNEYEAELHDGEMLKIPKIELDILHRYSELIGKGLLNEGFETYFISEAVQAIEFKLDETGAEVKSEAVIKMAKGIARRFIFDKPFLLCLKEKEARYPYLALWIGDSEFLVEAQRRQGETG